MEFLTGPAAWAKIAELVKNSGQKRFAVAFWGKGASEKLGIDQDASNVTIVCNLLCGGTNPAEIRTLRDLGATVLHSSALHAKVYLFPDAVILGSSNASANGLSYQDGDAIGWDEANIFSPDRGLVDKTGAWFETILKHAEPVTDPDLDLAQKMWNTRRGTLPVPKRKALDLLDALVRFPDAFEGPNYLTVVRDEMSKSGERALAKTVKERSGGLDWYAYEDWPELPRDALLVSFWFDPVNGAEFDGFFRTPKDDYTIPFSGGSLQMCYAIDDPFPAYPQGSDERWSAALTALWSQKRHWNVADGTTCISLSNFGRAVAKALDSSGDEKTAAESEDGMQIGIPELEEFIDETIRRAKEAEYFPNTFIQMRKNLGTLKAIETLVNSEEAQSGLRRLNKLGLLDWSVENAVLKFPSLFDEKTKELAAFRYQNPTM